MFKIRHAHVYLHRKCRKDNGVKHGKAHFQWQVLHKLLEMPEKQAGMWNNDMDGI